MAVDLLESKAQGKKTKAPVTSIHNLPLEVTGKRLRIAAVHDEYWLEGQVVDDPASFIEELRRSGLKADIFTFAQKIPDIKPRYKYPMEWDNVAAIPIISYQDWLARVSTDMRKDIKRAAAREVIVQPAAFDDDYVRGIVEIHNAAPIRQGRHFMHYGKDFDTVKREYGTYLERSEFLAAYYKNEMIGMLKLVYVGELACLMEIISKPEHFDKRPTNALVAKAVEVCEAGGKSYLTYGQLYYGNKKKSSLVAFKHRNGFQPIYFPRYFIPLTVKGRISIRLGLHRGLLGILPGYLITFLIGVRTWVGRTGPLRSKSSRRPKAARQGNEVFNEQPKPPAVQ